MSCKRAPNAHVLNGVSLSITILAILIALVAPGQLTGGGQLSAKPTIVPTTQDASPPLFLPAVVYYSGGNDVASVAVADLNGDGKPDIIVANACGNSSNCNYRFGFDGTVAVLLGNGDGTVQPAASYASGGETPVSVAVADANGDGKPDIIVANKCASGTNCNSGNGSVGILLGNGDGTFQAAIIYNSGGFMAVSLAVADFNGDGRLDLAVAHSYGADAICCSSPALGVLLGNGDGTFQPAVMYVWGGQTSIAVGDVNGDHRPDLVVTTPPSNLADSGVEIFLGNGDGSFQPPVVYDTGSPFPQSVAIADLNKDGRMDLVVDYGVNNAGMDSLVGILLGNGDGTFQGAVTYDSGVKAAISVTVSDVDGDVRPDLLLAGYSGLGVLLGNGDGIFQPALTYGSGGSVATSVVAADVNGDGKPDLVTGNVYANNGVDGAVGVLLNNSGPRNPTSTTLISSLNPSVYGRVIAFTAHVSSDSDIPTGVVQIFNGSALVGSGTLANGAVSIPVSALPAGANSVTASFLGGVGFAPSKSAALTQSVTKATTSTSLASSLNPVGSSQSLTLSATVTGQYGGAVTGSVTFTAGSLTLGNATLSGNVASLTTSFANAGIYSILAHYNGDSNNLASTSSSLSEKVIAATSVALTSSLNPSVVSQAVTFTARVASSSGIPPNGETIAFYNGSSVLGTGPLSGGAATVTTSSLPAGVFTIKAAYPGDPNFAPSTSAGLRQVVNSTTKYATVTTFATSLNPSKYGQAITFTAKVTSSGPLPPTGTVAFKWKYFTTSYTIGTATVNSSGIAVLTKSNLNADPYPLTAVYLGDENNLASTSPLVNQTVTQITSAATITSSLNPSTQGQAVTFTAKITSPTVLPTGPVTFTAGTTAIGTVQLSGGKASFTTSSLPVGSTVVKVSYNGNSNIKGGAASITQAVQP
jgi:Big-like domain-containing protein/VCBS repeat protein